MLFHAAAVDTVQLSHPEASLTFALGVDQQGRQIEDLAESLADVEDAVAKLGAPDCSPDEVSAVAQRGRESFARAEAALAALTGEASRHTRYSALGEADFMVRKTELGIRHYNLPAERIEGIIEAARTALQLGDSMLSGVFHDAKVQGQFEKAVAGSLEIQYLQRLVKGGFDIDDLLTAGNRVTEDLFATSRVRDSHSRCGSCDAFNRAVDTINGVHHESATDLETVVKFERALNQLGYNRLTGLFYGIKDVEIEPIIQGLGLQADHSSEVESQVRELQAAESARVEDAGARDRFNTLSPAVFQLLTREFSPDFFQHQGDVPYLCGYELMFNRMWERLSEGNWAGSDGSLTDNLTVARAIHVGLDPGHEDYTYIITTADRSVARLKGEINVTALSGLGLRQKALANELDKQVRRLTDVFTQRCWLPFAQELVPIVADYLSVTAVQLSEKTGIDVLADGIRPLSWRAGVDVMDAILPMHGK